MVGELIAFLFLCAAGYVVYRSVNRLPKAEQVISEELEKELARQKRVEERQEAVEILDIERTLHEATQLLKKKRPEGAEAAYLKVLKKDPDNARALNGLGLTYLELGDFENAALSFERAVKTEPLNPLLYNNLGLAQFAAEDYDKAIDAFEYSVHLDSKSPKRYVNLALAYKAKGDSKKEAATLEKAAEVGERPKSALLALADAYLRGDEPREALRVYEELAAAHPSDEAIQREVIRLRHIAG